MSPLRTAGIIAIFFFLTQTVTAQVADDYGTSEDAEYCPTLSITMQRGSRDASTKNQVTELQKFFSYYYDIDPEEMVTGFFGRITQGYVQKFQKENGLPSAGIVGSLTRGKIAKICENLANGTSQNTQITGATSTMSTSEKTLPPNIAGSYITINAGSYGMSYPRLDGYVQGYSKFNLAIVDALGKEVYVKEGIVSAGKSWFLIVDKPLPDGYLTVSAYIEKGKQIASGRIEVRGTPPPMKAKIISFLATPKILTNLGDIVTLKWDTIDTERCEIQSMVDVGTNRTILTVASNIGRSGTKEFSVKTPTTYVLFCQDKPQIFQEREVTNSLSERVIVNFLSQTSSSTELIRITAPNGGEQWEVGKLNTVTWSPYSYSPTEQNPARDVDVYLEDVNGYRIGKLLDTGKASLHTYLNINDYYTYPPAGSYYVRATNRLTGATDRSDAPFTVLAKQIDIQVNGSDKPVSLYDNQPIIVTFKSSGTFDRCALSGVRSSIGGNYNFDVSITSPYNGYGFAPYPTASTAVTITCYRGSSTFSDVVQVNQVAAVSTASLQVLSPNGGEVFSPASSVLIRWLQKGLSKVSVALYKNDQFYSWLVKDYGSDKSIDDTYSYSWNNQSSPVITDGDLGQKIFKIYATGMKADGSGYVDDKSNLPFSFISSTVPTTTPTILPPSCSITSDKSSYLKGELITFSWTSKNATYGTFMQNIAGGKDNLVMPGDKLVVNGSQQVTANVLGSPYVTLAVYNTAGQMALCTKSVSVTSAPVVVDDAVLYVAGVYQAAGASHSFCHSDLGTISVNVPASTKPVILALSSYEPVEWTVNVPSGTTVKKVILGGYAMQYVKGVDAPVETHFFLDNTRYTQGSATYAPGQGAFYDDQNPVGKIYHWAGDASCATKSALIAPEHRRYYIGGNDYFYAYTIGSAEYSSMVTKLKAWTGLTPASFVGSYSASSLTIPAQSALLNNPASNIASVFSALQESTFKLKNEATVVASVETADDDAGLEERGVCPKLTKTMERGSRDTSAFREVSELQKFLSDYYDIDPVELVSGYFGRITQGYVQKFQKEQGLPSAGIAGSLTRARIAKVCSGLTVSEQKSNTTEKKVVPTVVPKTTITEKPLSYTPTCEIKASPDTIINGGSTLLTWTSVNATSASWGGNDSGKDNIAPPSINPTVSGSTSFAPALITPLGTSQIPWVTLKVQGPGGVGSCSAYITIKSPVQVDFDPDTFIKPKTASPTISGTASGLDAVRVVLKKEGSIFYDSGLVTIVNGRWSVNVSPMLSSGQYMIYVYDNGQSILENGGYLEVL